MKAATLSRPFGLARARRSTVLRDRVTELIAQRILSGMYPQGTALPVEAELAAEFRVSRTVLRESVRTLAAKGLIETRQRAGTLVHARDKWHILDPDILTWMQEIAPDPEFVTALIEARAVVEPAAAALASQRHTAPDIARIDTAFNAMQAASLDSPDAIIRADVEFHLAMLKASRNPVFTGLGDVVSAAIVGVFRLVPSAHVAFASAVDGHGEVLEAVRARNADRACVLMEQLLGVAMSCVHKPPIC